MNTICALEKHVQNILYCNNPSRIKRSRPDNRRTSELGMDHGQDGVEDENFRYVFGRVRQLSKKVRTIEDEDGEAIAVLWSSVLDRFQKSTYDSKNSTFRKILNSCKSFQKKSIEIFNFKKEVQFLVRNLLEHVIT